METTLRHFTEEQVCRVVAGVLGHASAGPGDDLLALGASSLAMALVSDQLERRLGIVVPIRLLYEHPALGELAAVLAGAAALASGAGNHVD